MKKNLFQVMVLIVTIIGYPQSLLAQENASYRLNQANINGIRNGAFGYQALFSNTNGFSNTATGSYALYNNTTGASNTANGYKALYANTLGSGNEAMGTEALAANVTGSYNSANGWRALAANTTGKYNTATGASSLTSNTSGNNNSATGFYALLYNSTGTDNTASGYSALVFNTIGNNNTANGKQALYKNTEGNNNTAVGLGALTSNTIGNNNSALGYGADIVANVPTQGIINNATAIGANSIVNASNKVRLGDATVTQVEGPVNYTVSDGRFKTNITENDIKGLDFIMRLRPVVYNFDTRKYEEFLTKAMPDSTRKKYFENKNFSSSTSIRQSGFIAQEVEKVAAEAGYDFNGVHVPENSNDNYSIAYAQFVMPLVKGMQEQQAMIINQQKEIEQLKELVKKLATQPSLINSVHLSDNKLSQNAPNPVNEVTKISFTTSKDANKAEIRFQNSTGQTVKTVPVATGSGTVTVSTSGLNTGTYSYSLIIDGKITDTKTMVIQ